MYIGTKAVKPLPDFRLLITLESGEQRIFDVAPYLDKGLFRDLQDPCMFNTAYVSFDTVAWANGVDLCPETIYMDSVPVDTEEAVAS